MLKVELLDWSSPPEATAMLEVPELFESLNVVPVAFIVPPTAISWVV